jgi:hypothetical protein
MDENYYEELIEAEAEQLAVDEFGVSFHELPTSYQLLIRELIIDRLGVYSKAA